MPRLSSRIALVLLFVAVIPAASAFALSEVAPGYDLLQTAPGTSFAGINFIGVPLGSFDFGGSIGIKPTGLTDTILRRPGAASVAATPGTAPPILTELVAMNLVSAIPFDFGLGLGTYYMTLQSARGGPPSPGGMTITFGDNGGGTFSSFFDVFFDIRLGALDGPIAYTDSTHIQQTGQPWSRTPPSGSVTIPGVNTLLNGNNNLSDFWPGEPFQQASTQFTDVTRNGRIVPVPSAVWSGALVLGLLASAKIVRRRAV